MNRAEWLWAELRKYCCESNSTLTDAEKDRAILATVAHVADHDFGHVMGRDAWTDYMGRRSKHLPSNKVEQVQPLERVDNWKGRNAR